MQIPLRMIYAGNLMIKLKLGVLKCSLWSCVSKCLPFKRQLKKKRKSTIWRNFWMSIWLVDHKRTIIHSEANLSLCLNSECGLSLNVFCRADRTCGANWTHTGERHPVIFWCCYYFGHYGFTLDLMMVCAGVMYSRSCSTSHDGAWIGSLSC